MTILFMDGFDTASTSNILTKWTGGAINSIQTGRFDYGQCVRMAGNQTLTKSLGGNFATIGIATAIRLNTSILPSPLIGFRDAGAAQCDIRMRSDGKIDITRNGTVLATSAGTLSLNVWYHLEFKATIADSGGSAELKVNGATFVSLSSGDTKNTSNAYANEIILSAQQGNMPVDYDDLAVWNTSGGANNDWIGDCRVFTQVPDGAGNYSQWTPSTGNNNYQNVDDNPTDGDTTYNSTSTVNNIDTFTFPNISGTGTVKAVQTSIVARKDDAGARTIAPVIRRGSDYVGNNVNVGDSYAMYTQLWETDPIAAAAWTLANVNSSEFGIKLAA